jgi:hypothetical protein
MIAVAVLSANARIASAEHGDEDAIANLREAVAKKDRVAYDSPPIGSFRRASYWEQP